MNYCKFLVSCFLATTLAFAQFPWEVPAEETNSEPAPSYEPPPPPPPPPAPVSKPTQTASKPASTASEGNTVFDQVRGHAYNPFGTAGAANNIYDLILTPSEVHGQKFVYIAPADYLGYAAFDFGGGTALMGLDNSGDFGALVLGYATSAFGLALNYSVSKVWASERHDGGITESQRTTYPGDNIGLFFSLPLGFATIYANASWLTYNQSYSYTVEGSQDRDNNGDIKADYSTIDGTVGVIGNFGSLHYDVSLNAARSGGTLTNSIRNMGGSDNSGDVAIDPEDPAYLLAAVGINLGYVALQNETARAIVGFNNILGVVFLDKAGTAYKSDNIILLIISPNILGEFVVSENWLAFAGAAHNINLIAGDGDRNDDTSLLAILQNETSAFAGLRYKKANWALEAQVSANPFAAFAGDNILANFGGFIYF